MKPMTIGSALQPIVGSGSMPRTEVVKRVWNYIKKNNLQDAKERRNINADDNLRRVFGGKSQVSMFEMTKLINGHLS
jgi:chromatin remodeling complex protein RSC6